MSKQDAADKRVIIVTGSSRGLGRQIALVFGNAGERVVVNYVSDKQGACAVADEIVLSGGEAVPCKADVRDTHDVEAMAGEALKHWGRIDVLINNAGTTKDGLLLRMTESDWDSVMDANLKGPFHSIRAVSRVMMKQKSGHIINIASIAGIQGREGQGNYSASKAGLIGLTKASARELGRFNIKVNAVLPGYIPTDMGNQVPDLMKERVKRENALNRFSDSVEVARFLHHLSLMENVSGQVFNLDSRVL